MLIFASKKLNHVKFVHQTEGLSQRAVDVTDSNDILSSCQSVTCCKPPCLFLYRLCCSHWYCTTSSEYITRCINYILITVLHYYWTTTTTVVIITNICSLGYGQDTEESRLDYWQGEDISSPEPRPVLGLTQTPIQWVSRALSTGGTAIKFYFHPSSSEVKNEWSSTSTSPYAFMTYTSNLPLLRYEH